MKTKKHSPTQRERKRRIPALPPCLLCILSLFLIVADVRPSLSYDWVVAFMLAKAAGFLLAAALFLYLHRSYGEMFPKGIRHSERDGRPGA